MYQEKRPTCVTVIGWAWIIIGALMTFSAIMALFISLFTFGKMPSEAGPAPLFMKLFPLIAIFQMAIGVLGLISGIKLLKLKAWARKVLELLTWLLLLFTLGFMVFWIYSWISTSGKSPHGFDIIGVVMGVAITVIYVVPLIIMLKYLRREKVKKAVSKI